jgi:hypothetical protein
VVFKALEDILWPYKMVLKRLRRVNIVKRCSFFYESGTPHWKNAEIRISAEECTTLRFEVFLCCNLDNNTPVFTITIVIGQYSTDGYPRYSLPYVNIQQP